jgi:hypothetical protein
MARKYQYNIYDYNTKQEVGTLKAASYKEAYRNAQRQYGEGASPRLYLSDADEAYLRRVSINALQDGDATITGMAWPWFRLQNGRSIDETHYKNIINAMPRDLQIAYHRANGDYDELSKDGDFDIPYELVDFIGSYPAKMMKKIPAAERTPEKYAQVFGAFLMKASKADFDGYQGVGDHSYRVEGHDDVLDYIVENVPKRKFSEDLNNSIRRYIISVIKKKRHFNESFEVLPASIFSDNINFTKSVLKSYPSYISHFPKLPTNVARELWIYAFTVAIREGGFTGQFADSGLEDIIEEWVPEAFRNDPQLLKLYSAYEQAQQAAELRRNAKWKEESEAKAKAHMDKVSKDGNALANIHRNWHTPEMYQAAVTNNPKAIFHVPSEARTKDLWLQAVKGDPVMLEYVRPLELQVEVAHEVIAYNPKAIFHVLSDARTKDLWLQAVKGDPAILASVPEELQAEIKKEMSGGADVERIKQLAGTAKPTGSPPEEK